MYFSDFVEVTNLKELVEEKGFKLETVAFVSPYFNMKREDLINHLIQEYPTIHCIHGPFRGLDFGASKQDIINTTYYAYDDFHKIAKRLGVKKIVVHCNLGADKTGLNEKVRLATSFWETYLGTHKGVTYYIENVAEADWDYQLQVIDKVNSKDLKACLDVGHVNVNSKKSMTDWIKGLGSRIEHVHLHNNNGVKDLHSSIEKGAIDMKKTFEALLQYVSMEEWCLETDEANASIKWMKLNGYL